MNEIYQSHFEDYEQYKKQFDGVMKRTVGNFVSIGYLLTVARDTNILQMSGYSTMSEFAEKEYNLSESQASRFISIYEKYGDGIGNLLPEYRDHSYSLLCEMITLPETIAQEITSDYSREDIRDLKRELADEQKTSDIEILLEGKPEEPVLFAMLKEYLHSDPSTFMQARNACMNVMKTPIGQVLDALAPDGIGIVGARVQGIGRLMLSFKGEHEIPVLINPRSGIRREVPWSETAEVLKEVTKAGESISIENAWEQRYGEPFPSEQAQEEPKAEQTEKLAKEKTKEKKVKIAPAQKEKVNEKKTSKKRTEESADGGNDTSDLQGRSPDDGQKDVLVLNTGEEVESEKQKAESRTLYHEQLKDEQHDELHEDNSGDVESVENKGSVAEDAISDAESQIIDNFADTMVRAITAAVNGTEDPEVIRENNEQLERAFRFIDSLIDELTTYDKISIKKTALSEVKNVWNQLERLRNRQNVGDNADDFTHKSEWEGEK